MEEIKGKLYCENGTDAFTVNVLGIFPAFRSGNLRRMTITASE